LKNIIFYYLNLNTDVSVTLEEVVMDDGRNEIKKTGVYFRDIVPTKCDKFI